ncbi:MAG: protein adenylyltransferase SelO family protein, partial [Gammaproteobacteria bacterium]|nr:protein adenylyltransferase SelO family protein [Gammaproteobacteria bacterium]
MNPWILSTKAKRSPSDTECMSGTLTQNSKKSGAYSSTYTAFKRIDGDHPLKHAVENIYVGYQAFLRAGGEIGYFNFELAKEMGLIPQSHPHSLSAALKKQLLETFSLQIINEYDIEHKTKIAPSLIKANDYMATRYLQIQHPNKQGKTSGDGRSMWNGHYKAAVKNQQHAHWDISSCGTGATRLSPATANENKFFKTGDRLASYGCGRAEFSEGMIAALFSNMMHQKGIATERTLAVVRFKNGNSVNVRVAKNLLRPAHFFGYMKRGEFAQLKQLVDYHISREVENNTLLPEKNEKLKYNAFLDKVATDFATASAKFESEYIFCWMDWDGDNILMDGGIIDYGTIRQFGLFHHEYRYDDVNKMSTNITEQKNKAKYTIQRFVQIVDFLLTGKKKNIKNYARHSTLKKFDDIFQETLVRQLLVKIGFTKDQQAVILKNKSARDTAFKFQKQYRFFEKAVSGRRAY